ncbi:hypothetical protein FF1_015182 [Malus domestica]
MVDVVLCTQLQCLDGLWICLFRENRRRRIWNSGDSAKSMHDKDVPFTCGIVVIPRVFLKEKRKDRTSCMM